MSHELLTLTPREEALRRFLEGLAPLPAERLPTPQALDRVLAERIVAPHPMPHFARSAVDGYAVRAADTVGASEALPAYLTVVGEVRMGQPPDLRIGAGEAALIHTGSALPEGADAVVMVERTQPAGPDEVEVLRAVAVGENVIPVGEDVRQGEEVLARGTRLRPQELGGLMGLGVVEVAVTRRPRVAILATGDELVPPHVEPGANQVRDLNSTAIAALVQRHGGEPRPWGIIPDRAEALEEAARAALEAADVLVITAGSSASVRDMTAEVINRLGKPGVFVHGVPIRPGKPTILARCDGKPVMGLPGNPVSAMNAARLFLVPLLWHLQGAEPPRLGTVRARLTRNIPATPGRETYVPVRLERTPDGLLAHPLFGESNLIFLLVRGDGLVRIPLGATGLPQGAEVEVEPLR